MGARKSDVRHRNNLRACREAAGKSQRQLAAIMGVSEKSVSAWETGRVEMKADHLLALSNWLGCTPNDLLGYDGDARVVRVRAYEERYAEIYARLAPNVRDALETILDASSKSRRPK
ncbi:helix-turn-helix domain-containing protein [Parafannyhessea umbonata]|jgi:transcriptional regulator with XRE-family HTH domain|uniref:helix-turn-helix transcriptional regulator n=1 Tax=Parafannyhessea umbonata TaxID=604330 RepID=UPI0015691496|nr:helix-turn-helix transcriptional regulator [Parafannyhessea umbonata]